MGNKCKPVRMHRIIRQNRFSGFTLMEIIVVIAVLGALAAMAIPQFTGVLENSQKKTDEANIRIIESAVLLYQAEIGDIPAGVDTFNELVTELNRVGYLKNSEVKAVTKGVVFTYDSALKEISLTASPGV
ncbi:MAG: type pilus assembly protein PilA [Acetobacterium sp.]|uniref:competence type IV pilus major pilin ComGC n=2 Tax=Eubacteriaceae TaxID=186806 RepID=UPI00269C7304|nr:prepilin-type N-terminal cleavage/methylation domain-containing protein [Acetobacterium sp. K1/6]MDK2943214.1 type pilus assembly protein PilA [Acetobacterium sp.]MDZ5724749.1 prepilin-type N-terminal cleavage/methylation domain-containing protein [Acetobacterium sp. K1/6]